MYISFLTEVIENEMLQSAGYVLFYATYVLFSLALTKYVSYYLCSFFVMLLNELLFVILQM